MSTLQYTVGLTTPHNFFLYGEVVASPPPDWLLDKAKDFKKSEATQASMNNWGEDFTARDLHKNGKVYKNAFNHSVFLDSDCLEWAKNNITPNAKDIRIYATRPGLDRCGAHIDRTRNYTLIYLLESGGDQHETVFYKERGVNELIRPNAYHVDDYNQLEIISKVNLKIHKWNLVQGRILHSIENITQGRSSIQISLDEFGPELILTNTEWYNNNPT
jgi:hypothetical protein